MAAADFRGTPDLAEATQVASTCRAECVLALVDRAESRTLPLLSHVTRNVTFLAALYAHNGFHGQSLSPRQSLPPPIPQSRLLLRDSATIATAMAAADMVIRGLMVRITIPSGGGIRVRRIDEDYERERQIAEPDEPAEPGRTAECGSRLRMMPPVNSNDRYARSGARALVKRRARQCRRHVLVFRDQHKQEVRNYAIVGQTLWNFASQRTRKDSAVRSRSGRNHQGQRRTRPDFPRARLGRSQ